MTDQQTEPTETTEPTPTEREQEAQDRLKQSNDDRTEDKLRRRIRRAQEWRVQVWAQSELRIRESQSSLAIMGREEESLFEPQFDDDEMLRHYSQMPLSK